MSMFEAFMLVFAAMTFIVGLVKLIIAMIERFTTRK